MGYKEKVIEMRARVQFLKEQVKELEDSRNSLATKQQLLEAVNKFLASSIENKVTSTKHKLEALVNQGLEYIFGDSIKIAILSEFKNNKTIFSLKITKDGVNDGRAEDFGGGVLAVISFLLKVSAVLITNTKRVMVFDESLTFVSAEYQEPLSQFLSKLCEELNFTIILIAHQPKLATYADVIYKAIGTPETGVSFNKITKDDL